MFDIHVFALETLENTIITNCEPCLILHSYPYLIADLVLVSLSVSSPQIDAEKRGNKNNSFQHSFLFFSPLFYPETTHTQTFMQRNASHERCGASFPSHLLNEQPKTDGLRD